MGKLLRVGRAMMSILLALPSVLLLVSSATASANTLVPIHATEVPTMAGNYDIHSCSGAFDLGGGPYTDQDVWHFTLPGSATAANSGKQPW
jgi:hypothetical protein